MPSILSHIDQLSSIIIHKIYHSKDEIPVEQFLLNTEHKSEQLADAIFVHLNIII